MVDSYDDAIAEIKAVRELDEKREADKTRKEWSIQIPREYCPSVRLWGDRITPFCHHPDNLPSSYEIGYCDCRYDLCPIKVED